MVSAPSGNFQLEVCLPAVAGENAVVPDGLGRAQGRAPDTMESGAPGYAFDVAGTEVIQRQNPRMPAGRSCRRKSATSASRFPLVVGVAVGVPMLVVMTLLLAKLLIVAASPH